MYAGEDGFTVQVGKNTSLQGAVLDSQADAAKNLLDTGTLSWSDVKNTAKYKASGMGIGLSETTAPAYADSRRLNERGITPEVLPTVKGDATSSTRAGISAGTIVIRDKENQIQNLSDLNRDTQNSLQKLGEIFDKTKVKERQELVSELGKVGNRTIHLISEQNGWKDGSDEKVLTHAIFGGLLTEVSGGNISTGMLAGGVNEYVIGKIQESKGRTWMEKHPDAVQWISIAVGSAVGRINEESHIGSVISVYGTKWNNMYDKDITEGEFATKNDAYYAMYTKCDLELKNSRFNDYSTAEKIIILNSGLTSHIEKMALVEISSYLATKNDYTYVAASLFRHGLHGNGSSQYFPIGTAASILLQKTPEFNKRIVNLGENLNPHETKVYYTSIGTSGPALLAFGHIKLAVEITNNGDGSFSVNGQARDVYNFEALGSRNEKSLKEILKNNTISAMNDSAYILQRAGILHPFIYDIQIQSIVRK